MGVDNLLHDHVEQPHVPDLAVNLGWMGKGGNFETLLPLVLFLPEHSFMVKSFRWGGVQWSELLNPLAPVSRLQPF